MGMTVWTRGAGALGGVAWGFEGGVLFDSLGEGFFGADRRSTVFWMSTLLRLSEVSALLDRLFADREETETTEPTIHRG